MIVAGRLMPRRHRDRGAAAVEAALVIPILLMIIFGIIDFGRMLNAQLGITEAAREGARVSSFGGDVGDVRDRVDRVIDGAIVTSVDGCPSRPDPDNDAAVTVMYRFTFVTPVGALASFAGDSFDLTSTGVMPCHS